jgi:monoamine oxidase
MAKSLAPLLRHGARRNLPTRAGFARGAAPSRRQVLRVGAAGAAAALVGPLGCASHSSGRKAAVRAQNSQRTVVIVGAGFAGLACADTLAHAGVNVVLLEATSRAGGRVRTDRVFIPGDNVELGGEWIGSNHPTWLAYAQEFSLRLEEPGAAPEPEGVGEAAKEPAAEPGVPAPPTERPTEQPTQRPSEPAEPPGGTHVPRPVQFETEMETAPSQPRDGGGAEPRAAAAVRVLHAAMLQPAENPPPADAPAAPAAPDAPAPAPATQPAATQPATTQAGGEADEPIILGGKLIRGEEADKLYEEVDKVLANVIELARGIDPVRPWLSPNAAELDARSFAAFVADQQGLSDDARRLLIVGAESDNGVPADRMSLLAYLAMVAGGGFHDYYENSETYRLAEGNDALATALAQKLRHRIRFNSMVDAIRRTPDGVIVRTRGGDYYRGDALVIAAPPTVWNQFRFDPPLPEALTPQMGENVKLVLALREAVWEKDNLTSEVTSDGLVGLTWAATDETRTPVALTLFSGASQAENLRRVAPAERQGAAIASIAAAYPGLADAVTKHRFVDWPGMPLVRASYSFPAPGQVTAFGPVLVDGLVQDGMPPVLFAGEHTAYGFIGYMEGALSSGVRAARILLGAPTPVRNETAPETPPAETQPAETQPATQPVAEPVPEGTPA